MIKAAFFDIDGTLLSFATHRVPDSAWAAINAMRERGIKVFIATGRERDMIPDVVATGFDGYVTINGQSCFDENGEFRHQSIDPEGVRLVVEQVEAGLYEALFMTKGYSFVSGHSPRVLHNERHCGLTYAVADPRSALDFEIMQMCAYLGEDEEHIVAEGNPHVHTTRWCDDFCDVMPVGGGKPEGVPRACGPCASATASRWARRLPLATAATTSPCSKPWAWALPWETQATTSRPPRTS